MSGFEDAYVGDTVTPRAVVTAANADALFHYCSKFDSINFSQVVEMHHH